MRWSWNNEVDVRVVWLCELRERGEFTQENIVSREVGAKASAKKKREH